MRRRSPSGWATPAACWTASTPSDGSQPGSPLCAPTCNAAPKGPSRRSIPQCPGAQFALTKRPDTLDADERARLDALFETHPRLKTAWDALGELHGLYPAKDRNAALEALGRFADIYRTGDIPEFSDVADTFLAWHPQIPDRHHTGRPPNGRIERTSNLLQVLRRRAHGFTNHANLEARGLLPT